VLSVLIQEPGFADTTMVSGLNGWLWTSLLTSPTVGR
jgi:hypothetical protein